MSNRSNGSDLNSLAANATLHCLTGCAIGEILGLMIGTALGMSNVATIALAVALAFLFGGLVVSMAAQLEEDGSAPPAHSSGQRSVVHNGATIPSGR